MTSSSLESTSSKLALLVNDPALDQSGQKSDPESLVISQLSSPIAKVTGEPPAVNKQEIMNEKNYNASKLIQVLNHKENLLKTRGRQISQA